MIVLYNKMSRMEFSNLEIAFMLLLTLSVLPCIHQIIVIFIFQCCSNDKHNKKLHHKK